MLCGERARDGGADPIQPARRHTAAISQTDALLPFEVARHAILLEQARDIAILRQKLDALDGPHHSRG